MSAACPALKRGRFAWLRGPGLVLGLLLNSTVYADHAAIENARSMLVDGSYRISAHVVFDMDEKVQEALDNGVPLVVDFEVEVVRIRHWWWPELVSEWQQRYKIYYHALSRRYIVKDISGGSQQSFRDINDALETIGNVYDVPVLEESRRQPDADYRVRMRAAFDVEALPTPIRLWAYFGSDWQLTGGWAQWPLTP